jgi:hypothetical protein
MYIVRDTQNGSGTSYLIEASESYDQKYRMAKVARRAAKAFATKKSANNWASRMGADVVAL